MPDGDPDREGLPGRCDKNWFSNVFLGGQGKDRSGTDSIWDLTGTFQAYDPMALLAALPGVRDRFLNPLLVAVEGSNGQIAFHEVVGLSESMPGVKPEAPLGQWLHGALLNGLAVNLDASQARGAKDLAALEDGIVDDKSEETRSELFSMGTSLTGSRLKEGKDTRGNSSTEAGIEAFQFTSLNWRFSRAVKRASARVNVVLEELHFH
jgi:hypothetical protein